METTQKYPLSFGFILLAGAILLSGVSNDLFAQTPPLKTTDLFDRSEVIMVWDEGTTNGAHIFEENLKLKFNYQGLELNERLTGSKRVTSDTTLSFDQRQIDLVSGDFIGNNRANYLYSVTGDNDSLHLVLANRGKTLNSSENNIYKFDGRILKGKNLILGDVNGDGISEFVVGYRSFDEELANVALFGFDKDFKINLISELEEKVSTKYFVLDLSDLDGDGDDELIIGYTISNASQDFYLKVYDFDKDYNYTAKTPQKLDLHFGANSFGDRALSGIDFDSDGVEELVIAFTKNEHDSPNNPDTYIYTAELMDDPSTDTNDLLEKIVFYKDDYATGTYNYNGTWQILLKSGDLNGDGVLEVLLGCQSGVQMFNASSGKQLEHVGKQSGVGGFDDDLPSVNYFDVADVTGDDLEDIVAIYHYFSNEPVGEQGFGVQLYQYDSLLNYTNLGFLNQYNQIDNGGGGGMHRTHFAVSLSDFDGDQFRIGEYTSLGCFTDVIRPVTVLNTPPVHIDYINGVIHDVNECYGDNDCASSVQKSTEQFTQEEFSIETSSTGDWGYQPHYTLGIDQELTDLGVGVSMSPIDISAYFGGDMEEVVTDVSTTSIGKSTSISRFQTASMDKRFSRDDALLTIVSDYERWEYPVFNEYDELLGEIVILIPQTTNQENWLRGRQVLEVAGMVQLHEPGNLLSYRKFSETPEELMELNPDIKEIISIANEHELDLNSNYTETITWGEDFENQDVSVENTVETNPSGGINFGGFQPRVQDGSVAEEEVITSHVFKVGKNLGIEVFGSSLAANSYEFKVKPYYYWSRNGALVVDYMIDLSEGSFWQQNYSLQDPGFILPNRLDSLKAKNDIDKITDLDEYIKTPSIIINPAIPVNGDTVKVTTIVHNLSISHTSDAVELSFYLGDPDKGGRLISDVDGNTLFSTQTTIEDQHYASVEFEWVADFDRDDRMYAMIDPNKKLAENKLDNNKAWAPVQRFGSCGETETAVPIPFLAMTMEDRFTLYPNPARDHINLSYAGPDISEVVVTITDLSGKRYLSEELRYLEMDYKSTLDVGALPLGVYIVSFSTNSYRQHTKLLID